MNKSMLLTAISLGTLAISFPNKADESKTTTLTVDCKNDVQKKCVLTEFQSFDKKFSLCLDGRATDSLILDEFVDKKLPSKSPTDIIKQSRKDWIANVSKACVDSPTEKEKEAQKKAFIESSSWSNQLMLGYSLSSSYNDDGEHEGLTEQNPMAQFSFDGRWFMDGKMPVHWEIGGLFATSASLTEDNEDEAEGEEDSEDDTADDDADTEPTTDTSVSKPTFNDVVGSVDIYTKVTFNLNFRRDVEKPLNDYFAIGVIGGFKSRDKVKDDLDSVIYYYGPLAEYRYYGKDMLNNKNSIPRGKVWAGYLNFEEYGGVENEKRLILVGEWQLNDSDEAEPEDGRFVVGLKANLGEGADDVGIYFAYRSGFDSIKSFLTAN